MNTLFEPPTPFFCPTLAITFTVFGTPRPQGSTRAFVPKGWSRPIITSDNPKLKPWRQQIAGAAVALNIQPFERDVALAMSLSFYFEKPPSAKKRIYPTVKPDSDKLIRAILDSLTGILYADDAQVVRFNRIEKLYGQPERVEIQVEAIA